MKSDDVDLDPTGMSETVRLTRIRDAFPGEVVPVDPGATKGYPGACGVCGVQRMFPKPIPKDMTPICPDCQEWLIEKGYA